MKRSLILFSSAFLFSLVLTGCQNPAAGTSSTTSASAAAPVDLVVWHDNDDTLMKAIETKVNTALSADKITLHCVKKAGVQDQVKLYGNDATNGPDMFFEAQDPIGVFAQMGIVAPLSDILPDSYFNAFLKTTIDAGTYKNVRYMVPLYFESLLFMYNKDLWKGAVPSTTDDLLAYAEANTDANAGMYGVLNQHTGAYNVAPLINGYGGYIINNDAKPGLNLQATKDAVSYNKRFSAYQSDGEYNTVTTLFTEKKAHSIISGPWLVSSIKAAGINLGTKPLSSFKLPNGRPLCPYIGVQSFGVCKHALAKKAAIAKVFNVIASKEVGVGMAKDFGCTPAVLAAYEDSSVTSNEMIANTKETIATSAIPMPNIPEMSVMWGPVSNLLTNVNLKGADVNTEAEVQQKAAEQAIADMH